MRAARTLHVATIVLWSFSSIGTLADEVVAATTVETTGVAVGEEARNSLENFQTREEEAEPQYTRERQLETLESRSSSSGGGGSSATTADTASGTEASTCSWEGAEGSCVAPAATTGSGDSGDRQEDAVQQQQPNGDGAIAVETGEHDGVRIEFVGKAEGTIPAPDPAINNEISLQEGTASDSIGSSSERAWLPPAADDADSGVEFELLRCEGGASGYRDEADAGGALTVKGVCDHMLKKLMESAQQV